VRRSTAQAMWTSSRSLRPPGRNTTHSCKRREPCGSRLLRSRASTAMATSSESDTALFTHATGRFQVPAGGTYVVRVAGTAPSQIADTGAYRLFLYPIDRRPEHVTPPSLRATPFPGNRSIAWRHRRVHVFRRRRREFNTFFARPRTDRPRLLSSSRSSTERGRYCGRFKASAPTPACFAR